MRLKKNLLCCILLFSLLSLAACGSSSALPDGFDDKEVRAQAEQVIDLLVAGDYTGVYNSFGDELKDAVTAQKLEDSLSAQFAALGAFQSISQETTAGDSDPTVGDFAIVVAQGTFENGTATFTISIDRDGKLCGLFVK